MDHLLTYETRQLGYWVKVPYLGESPDTIPTASDLFTFAGSSEFCKEGSLDLRLIPLEKSPAILQHWLYFGLLREFFLLQEIVFPDKDFTYTTAENKVLITTIGLPLLIIQWRNKEMRRKSGARSQVERLNKVLNMLNYVRQNVRNARAVSGTEEYHLVLASIQVLGNTIANEMKLPFRRFFLGFDPGFGPSKTFVDRLVSRQWCPRDVAMVEETLYSDSQFYCTMISPPRKDFSHADCSRLECKAMNVDESTYRTQHVSGQCGCTFLEVPIKVLHHLVDQQAIPLVRYHSGSLEVTQLRMDEPNVVFSHVWADGLGNVSGKNALPTCQVIRLQEIANMTFVEHDSTPIPFYIDTLCVPREMEFRKKAIKKMRDVYKSAMKVLVLDREIQALSSDDSKTQKITTIYFSGWMRRLWTYQEGALNKSLFFKLSDTILKIDSIWAWLSESWDTAEGGCVRHMISLVVHTLRVQDTRAIPPALSLVAINDAFRWRSTSRSEDEAIVISILLGLDTETLLKAKGTERMKMVLQSLGKVPLPLASLSSDRMEEEGYTWAPKSLLNVKKHFLYAALSSWYSNMLRINPQITSGKVDNEADVADVLETGALSFKSKGYAIYPAGVSPSRISSPFWLIEFVGMHEGMVVVEKCWRVLSWPDLKGLPQALPQEVFFLIPVERPHRNSWERYLVMTAFIVLASKETQDFVQQRFFAEEFSIDVLPCRFYCRVEVCMMDMSDLETQPLYKAEFFDGDAGESYKVPRTDIKPTESFSHLVRQIHCKKWVVS